MLNKSFLKKVVKSEVDIEAVYIAIANLNYAEYMEFISDFLSVAINEGWTKDTNDSRDKYWSRLMAKIKTQYNFVVPVSTSPSAIEKRYQRMG